MGTIAKNDGGNFTPAPAGNHVAICYGVIDLGTQHSDAFVWKEKSVPASDQYKILLMWELPNEMIEVEGKQKPAMISNFYTLSLNEKATLRIHLEAWRSRIFSEEELCGFDIVNVLGKHCMINIVHKENGKAKVAGIAAMVKGMNKPDVTNALISFSLDTYSAEVFDSLSEGIQGIIKKSPEWQALNPPVSGFKVHPDTMDNSGQIPNPGYDDDDIPF